MRTYQTADPDVAVVYCPQGHANFVHRKSCVPASMLKCRCGASLKYMSPEKKPG